MFTGIIRDRGVIAALERNGEGARLEIHTLENASTIERGESIAVNGVCLTALPSGEAAFFADVSPETLRLTTLGRLSAGVSVNIERALALGDRLGGHLVQGHVDAMGTLMSIAHEGEFAVYRWSFPSEFQDLVVPKGSIAVDGISLTVVDPDDRSFAAALIPETLQRTNLRDLRIGDPVNLEFDIMAKYARKLMAPYLRKD